MPYALPCISPTWGVGRVREPPRERKRCATRSRETKRLRLLVNPMLAVGGVTAASLHPEQFVPVLVKLLVAQGVDVEASQFMASVVGSSL